MSRIGPLANQDDLAKRGKGAQGEDEEEDEFG
jgi:hypothetical protein